MNPISEILARNLTTVFFVYGLAFFVMGLALTLASRRASEFTFARAIVPLAVFGLAHGAHEWIEMFQRLAAQGKEYHPALWLEISRVLILLTSFLMLALFGYIMGRPGPDVGRRGLRFSGLLGGIWLAAVLLLGPFMVPGHDEWVARADVLSRYLVGVPGALLGAWGMLVQQRTFREHGMPQFGRDLVWCATALLLYGTLGQVFVPQTTLFPSSVVNSTLFMQWFGVPVQLFRAVLAIVLAFFIVRALDAFELENRYRLARANEARLAAQADALAAERGISLEREQMNARLRHTARELALLLDLSNLLAKPLPLEVRLSGVLRRVQEFLSSFDAGLILLKSANAGAIEVGARLGFDPAEAEGTGDEETAYAMARGLGRQCVASGQVMCRHLDGSVMTYTFSEAIRRPRCHTVPSPLLVVAVPLLTQQATLGSLVLAQTHPNPLRAVAIEELEYMMGVARQLGLSIENTRLYRQAQTREKVLEQLLHQVVNAQESERRRIARELHDATSQSLTAIALGLRGIETSLETNGQSRAELAVSIRELKGYSTDALGELRHIIADLRPSLLDDMGLVAALRWYTQDFEQRQAIHTRLVVPAAVLRLPAEHETVLFRITQEALANVARHAQASDVTVCLERTAAAVSLTVEDNGRGFETGALPGHRERSAGWGVAGMRERALLLGGICDITSTPGAGTSVRVALPLAAEQGDVQD